MRKQNTLSEIADAAAKRERNDSYHCMPGNVIAFHAATATTPATVDVQPATHDVRFVIDTGARFSEPWALMQGIPIAWPKFGPFLIQGPMKAGDRVLLIAFDLDPTAWQQSGKPGDPADTRRHGGGYWVALPTDLTVPGVAKSAAAAASALVIGVDGSNAQLVIPTDGSTIKLGANATDFVALASLVATELGKISSALDHLVAPSGGGPVTGNTYTTPGNVAATLAKAK